MGTWGAGNFDNDDAQDYLIEFTDTATLPLVARIEEFIASPQWDGEDDPFGSQLMAGVETLCILCETLWAMPPKPEFVLTFRDAFLPLWDEIYADDGDAAEGFYKERRAVITATLDRLLQLSEKWHTQT